ncbi:MAG: OmpA family protein [Flavobacteriales bacterium]
MSARIQYGLLTIAFLTASCSSIRMNRADRAFDLMQYPKAEGIYERMLRNSDDRIARAKLAHACLSHNDLQRAALHYGILNDALPLSGDTAVEYGRALMGLGRTAEAADMFYNALQRTPENRLAQDLFESAQGYQTFFKDSGRYDVRRLIIPGVQAAFAPVQHDQGLVMAAVPEKGRPEDPWSGHSYLDLVYSAPGMNTTWARATPLPGIINGDYHEGPASFSADGRTIYFTRSNYVQRRLMKDEANTSHLMLFRSTMDSSGEWGGLHAFGYNGERWSTGHPALSRDGRTLYFASDRPGGQGGMDIWRCRDLGTGWSEPENLGPTINTPGNELFPTVNGDALHFASTGHFNMGGLDIFETREQEGDWSVPRNLGYPINTVHDDMHFVLDSSQVSGYLSSDRSGTDQVYTFTIHEPTFQLDGLVLDDEGGFLPNAEVSVEQVNGDEVILLSTDVHGRFGTKLASNCEYLVKAHHDGMLAAGTKVSTKGLVHSDTLWVKLQLDRVRIGASIAIRNIYYDYDAWDIRPDAALELDHIAGIISENPGLSFELSSHTDSRGSSNYNLVLSDARANSAVNYLIRQGVDPDRITARGYGEEMLANGCRDGVHCTEEDHQANRRTEFKVIGNTRTAQVP